MKKMSMQEYIEDYAKFLCLEESEGALFYFLPNRDRYIAVGRDSGIFQDKDSLDIYQQTEKNIIKYYLNQDPSIGKSHNQNYVMFDLLTVNPILSKFKLLYGSSCKHIILVMCLNRLFL